MSVSVHESLVSVHPPLVGVHVLLVSVHVPLVSVHVPLVSVHVPLVRMPADAHAGTQPPCAHQPLVAGKEDGVEHRLVKKEVTHPLRYNHVHFGHTVRQLDILHLPFYHRDNCRGEREREERWRERENEDGRLDRKGGNE